MTNQESNQPHGLRETYRQVRRAVGDINRAKDTFAIHPAVEQKFRELLGNTADGATDRRSRQMQVLEEMDRYGTSSPEKRRRGRIAVPAALAVATLLTLSPRARETAGNIAEGFRDIPANIDNYMEEHNGRPNDLPPNPADGAITLENQPSTEQGGLPVAHSDIP